MTRGKIIPVVLLASGVLASTALVFHAAGVVRAQRVGGMPPMLSWSEGAGGLRVILRLLPVGVAVAVLRVSTRVKMIALALPVLLGPLVAHLRFAIEEQEFRSRIGIEPQIECRQSRGWPAAFGEELVYSIEFGVYVED